MAAFDIVEDSNVVNPQPKLRPAQPPKSLDSRTTQLGRLAAQVPFNGIHNLGAIMRPQASQLHNSAGREQNPVSHSGYSLARLELVVKLGCANRGLTAAGERGTSLLCKRSDAQARRLKRVVRRSFPLAHCISVVTQFHPLSDASRAVLGTRTLAKEFAIHGQAPLPSSTHKIGPILTDKGIRR